jgi:hypothetical protein
MDSAGTEPVALTVSVCAVVCFVSLAEEPDAICGADSYVTLTS